MATPDQLLADPGWRRRHSTYTLWALLIGFGFVSFLYTGSKAKNQRWIAWGAVYGVLVIAAIAIGGSLSPDDPEAPVPAAANAAHTVYAIVWVVSAVHVFRARKEWLRWKARNANQAPWYEASASAVPPPPPADLGGIGLGDPTSDFLASTAPPPPPTQPATGRLPAPPTGQPRLADLPQPPPPRPPLESEGMSEAAVTPIDLNTAAADELASLPGVGVATAHRIVQERDRRGGFTSVDEAAMAVKVQPHVRSRLQQRTVVSGKQQPRRRSPAGRVVDI